jgi:hypothetical protein
MADEITYSESTPYPARFPVRFSEIINRVSWGAVWAGVMIALGMEMLFALFGFFIGFGMYHWGAANPWAGISVWTTVWYLVTAGWSMFFGAWCAARLSGSPTRGAAVLHGITTWGLATVATVLLVTVATWGVLREGVDVLTTATLAAVPIGRAAVTTPLTPQNAGPLAQATAMLISGVALRIWGGILLGFITALFGGMLGRAPTVLVGVQETTPGPTRLAA